MRKETIRLESDTKGFHLLSEKLLQLAGIHLPLNEKNLSLMAGRMMKVLKILEIDSYKEFSALLDQNDKQAKKLFLEAMTTHTTHFFRESVHYTRLAHIISKHYAQELDLRIWCAACSTGEEPYSIAMTLLGLKLPQLKFRILATDIDERVVQIAAHGVYHKDDLKSVPAHMQTTYFKKGRGESKDFVRVSAALKNHITFSTFNLTSNDYNFKKPFHIIFLRNVLIYFNRESTGQVLNHMSKVMEPGGYIFVGLSEAGMDHAGLFEKDSPGVFHKSTFRQKQVAS